MEGSCTYTPHIRTTSRFSCNWVAFWVSGSGGWFGGHGGWRLDTHFPFPLMMDDDDGEDTTLELVGRNV